MTKPILYSSVRSPHCLKVAIFLHEKGIVFDRVEIDLPAKEQKTPEYLVINPLGLVPAYQDDYGYHQDSLLIMHYLEWRYPELSLFPSREHLPEVLTWIEKSSSAYRDVSHHLYWQLIEPPIGGTDWKRVNELKEQGNQLLDDLENLLSDKNYLFGAFGVVDIAFIPWIYGYNRFDMLDKAKYPTVVEWVDRITSRESFIANYQKVGRSFKPHKTTS